MISAEIEPETFSTAVKRSNHSNNALSYVDIWQLIE